MNEIEKQCRLALSAVEAVLPIAEKAGIETSPEDAYDEWEILTQAVFEAFVVLPVCDTTGKYSQDQFHRLGFDVERGQLIVTFTARNKRWFLFDFSRKMNGEMVFESRPYPTEKNQLSEFFPPEDCSNFEILMT